MALQNGGNKNNQYSYNSETKKTKEVTHEHVL